MFSYSKIGKVTHILLAVILQKEYYYSELKFTIIL